jgi:hypothetical protein
MAAHLAVGSLLLSLAVAFDGPLVTRGDGYVHVPVDAIPVSYDVPVVRRAAAVPADIMNRDTYYTIQRKCAHYE